MHLFAANFTAMNSTAHRYYEPKCLPNPESKNLFTGFRRRVKRALEALPSSISYSDAMKQAAKFRAARKTKS